MIHCWLIPSSLSCRGYQSIYPSQVITTPVLLSSNCSTYETDLLIYWHINVSVTSKGIHRILSYDCLAWQSNCPLRQQGRLRKWEKTEVGWAVRAYSDHSSIVAHNNHWPHAMGISLMVIMIINQCLSKVLLKDDCTDQVLSMYCQ